MSSQQIGEYRLLRLVGEGSMGRVYEAVERLTRRRVAVKVLKDELVSSDEVRRLFLAEIGVLTRLDHDNVVRCLSCTEDSGKLVMVLELLDGTSLRDALRVRGRLGWREVVSIATQIASALDAAHGQSSPIVHRDLRPENVMIAVGGHIKVLDFGIANVMHAVRKSSTTHTAGTLQYMSPEQIDAAEVDGRSDLYSLGLVMYEMLTGAPPFWSHSPRDLLNAQCTQPPPPFAEAIDRDTPAELTQLVFQLLAKHPDERPSCAAAVRDALMCMVAPAAESVTQAAPASPSPRVDGQTLFLVERAAARHSWRVRTAIGGVVVALLALVAGGAWAATAGAEAQPAEAVVVEAVRAAPATPIALDAGQSTVSEEPVEAEEADESTGSLFGLLETDDEPEPAGGSLFGLVPSEE